MTARSDDEIRADLDIDAIEARAQATTSGPWYAYDNIGEGADAEFVAHARTDVHALVAEVRELRDSRERAIRWAVTLEGQTAAALELHQRSVSTAGELTPGRCWYCEERPALELLDRYQGYLNGARTKVWLHDHIDPEPHCTACAGDEPWDISYADWPCATARALGVAALTGSTE